jgi:MOSC domain-containing protein YiiM
MRVLSTNCGRPESISFQGIVKQSSMNRKPVPAGLRITYDGVIGDAFDGVRFHGTPDNRVYGLALDTHQKFARELSFSEVPSAGAFGENLTLDELSEAEIYMGDIFQVGTSRLQATYPRIPCSKLNFRFQNEQAMSAFLRIRRPGVYFRVLEEGNVKVGDQLQKISEEKTQVSIHELYLWLTKQEKLSEPRLAEIKSVASAPEYVKSRLA